MVYSRWRQTTSHVNNIHEWQNYKAKSYYPDNNCRVPDAHQSKLIEIHENETHVKIKI
jgi:hypothetical protein